MATATIPELIQPGVLYTPDDTAVSINSGYLPNTDDALTITSNVVDFRAYQPAVDGIHYHSDPAAPSTLLFWYANTQSDVTGTDALNRGSIIMGVMDVNFTVASAITTGMATAGYAWAMGLKSSANGSLIMFRAVGAASSRFKSGTGLATNVLSQRAFLDDGGTSFNLKYNGVNVDGGSSGLGTPGTPGALTDPYFGIGPYATTTGMRFPSAASPHQIAKIALFNRVLTDAELSDLYTSMTLGPPSP